MSTTTRAGLFVLYYASLLFGILALPVALLARRAGIPVPLYRLLDPIAEAYASQP